MGKILKLDGKEGKKWKALVIPVVLILLFLLAFVIRSVFYWPPAIESVDEYGDEAYLLSGNDPNYHKRAADYAQETHTHLVYDPMLDYPRGGPNPNPPLYAWSISLMGYIVSPFMGGDLHTATWYVMEFAAAFWAALTVFPVYIFTRDMFGKKPGIIAAFFIAVMAGNVERTPVGFSDHDAFIVFFAVLSFLFLMRALRMLNNRTYIKNWFNAKDVAQGTKELLSENKKAFLYSMLAGLSIAGLALAWKGVVYILAIILVYYVFHLSIKKLKKEEGLGIALIVLLALGLSIAFAFPYYYIRYFTVWFESPFFVFVAMCLLALLLVPTRDLPWLLVVPLILVLVVGGMYVLSWFFPSIVDTIFSLQGYFVRTKLYETIAEAQAPDFSRMVFSYGVVTFYLALVGAAIAAYRLPKEKWRNDYILTVIWAIVAIYMAMTAVRFMYNATPVFAIFSGWITYEIIRFTGFDKLLKTYRGLKSEPLQAIRKSVKARHVLVSLFIVFLIIWPNFWFGFDAGVPFEEKKRLDQGIYDSLPDGMRPTPEQYQQAGGQWWLGAFGTAYPSDYWVDGMFWLADQDTETIPEERPAFISWWDYGHWAVHMGEHPAAADNFQNGFQWAGNYISAQNESVAIALVAAKIIDGTFDRDPEVLNILEKYIGEEKKDIFVDVVYNGMDYKDEVLDNPHIYGPHDKNRMDKFNIKFLIMSRLITTTLELEEIVNLLHDLEEWTGYSMRYFAVDTRLLPVGPKNTGIYYAPIKLSDQDINDFLVVFAIGNDGSRTNVNDEAAMRERYENLDYQVEKYEIEYKDMFYNSMFYRAYVGWKPIDADINEPGIPTITRANDVGRQQLEISGMPPIQGWGMKHHRLEYRTQYWNPNRTDPAKNPSKWQVVSPYKADQYRTMSESDDPDVVAKSGVVDNTFRGLFGGVFFLKYYDGAFINGTITMEDGTPLEGVRVTVYDDLELASPSWPGAPHGYTHTDEMGRYSIIAPYGNVTVRVSSGGVVEEGVDKNSHRNQLLMQMEKRILNDTIIKVTDNQAMRVKEDSNGDGIWDFNIRNDVKINFSDVQGKAYWDLNGNAVFDEEVDEPMVGQVSLTNSSFEWNRSVEVAANGSYLIEDMIPDDYNMNFEPSKDQSIGVDEVPVDPDTTIEKDLVIIPSNLNGTVVDEDNKTIAGAKLAFTEINYGMSYSLKTAVNGTYDQGKIFPGNYTLSMNDERYSALDILIDIEEGTNTTQNITISHTIEIKGNASLPDDSPASGSTIVFRNVADDSLSVNIQVGDDGGLNSNVPPGNYSVNGKVIKDGETFVFMRTLDLRQDVELDARFERAFKINGTIYDDLNDNGKYDPPVIVDDPGDIPEEDGPTIPGGTATLKESRLDVGAEFQGATGNISLIGNSDGYYEVYLTPGQYSVYSYSLPTTDGNYSGILTLDVTKDEVVHLEVVKGTRFEGTVFYDVNDDGISQKDEILPGAKMLIDDGEDSKITYVNGTGSFNILLPDGTYDVSVQTKGYIDFNEELSIMQGSFHKNIILLPENISVSGTVGHDANNNGIIDEGEALEVLVNFIPEDPMDQEVQVQTDENGTFVVDLFPQNFTIQVDFTEITVEGKVRYQLSEDLSLFIGADEQVQVLPVDKTYKVHGNLFFDANDNGIINTGERRGPGVEFLGPDNETVEAKVTSGEYEVWLKKGTYYYYSDEPDPRSPTDHTAALGVIVVSGETEHTIMLIPATRINGVVYFDQDEDLEIDVGEQERDVDIRIAMLEGEVEVGLTWVMSIDVGEYSIYLPIDTNYSFTIDNEYNWSLYDNNYTVRYSYKTILEAGDDDFILHDITVDKFFLVTGKVTYDGPEGPEDLVGVKVVFDEFSAYTDQNGEYSVFVRPDEYDADAILPGFVLFEGVFGNRTIDFDKAEQNFIMDPVNVTVEGHVFVDLNGNGLMDQKKEGIKASVDFIAADDNAQNASIVTDGRGTFQLDLEPGRYFVWIEAGSGIDQYVMFDHFALKASGEIDIREFELEKAMTLQGTIYLEDTDGDKRTPTGANMTVYNNLTGVTRTVQVNTRQYEFHLPEGEYNITGHYKNSEYDRKMDYLLFENINLTKREKRDLVFIKNKLFHTEFEWDETQRVLLSQNGSVFYDVTVTNVGNEPGIFDLQATGPTGWETEAMTKKINLDIDASTSFKVRINVSMDAKAGENTIHVMTMSQVDEDMVNTTKLYVDVVQVYNITIGKSNNNPIYDQGKYQYFLLVENTGNGNDWVNISLRVPWPKWNIEISEPNPMISGGQSKDIEIRLEPEDPKNMIVRDMSLTFEAVSEGGKTAEYKLSVTFPDLTGDIEVSGPGVKTIKESEPTGFIPSFELVPVVMALAVVAIYYRRKWGDVR